MKKQAIYFAMLLLLPLFCRAQDDKKAISQILDRQAAGWNKGKLEEFMQDYWKSDSLLYIGKNGPRYGWNKALEGYKKAYPNKEAMGILSFDLLKVDLLDKNHAFVVGRWHLKRKADAPQGYFTLLVRRFADGWKIVTDHSS